MQSKNHIYSCTVNTVLFHSFSFFFLFFSDEISYKNYSDLMKKKKKTPFTFSKRDFKYQRRILRKTSPARVNAEFSAKIVSTRMCFRENCAIKRRFFTCEIIFYFEKTNVYKQRESLEVFEWSSPYVIFYLDIRSDFRFPGFREN